MTEELKTDIIINRDALFALRELPDESVNCCVTSPPYYALRDYGLDAQIGREDTPEEYIERLVAVFHELKRVLRSDGTFWLNIADTYCGTGNKGYYADPKNPKGRNGQQTAKNARAPGCKQKDLIGIPWLLAFALRADGWYLRSDIIWQKENPMPESCKDRPSRCYEHIFLLTKSKKYFYDAAAIAEPIAATTAARYRTGRGAGHKYVFDGSMSIEDYELMHRMIEQERSEQMAEPILSGYLSNLGKYTEGRPAGEWVTFPTTAEHLKEVFDRIGIDFKNYEEWHFTEYQSSVPGLTEHLSEYSHLDELNYLGKLLEMQFDDDREKFIAAIEYGDHTDSLQDIINLAQNLDCYWGYPSVHNEEEYGHYLVDELEEPELPEEAKKYFMYEEYGRDASINDGGMFTEQGYIYNNRNTFTEWYDGRDVPEEYRITPQPPQPERPDPSKVEMDAAAPGVKTVQATEQPQEPRPVIPIVLTSEKPAEKLKEITDRLEQGIAELFDSERYKEYLRVMSKFHNYSFNNTLLIAMQKPDASLVAGFSAWKNNFGRNVMKGQKGIKIIAPSPFKIKQEMEKIDPHTQKPVIGKDGKPVTEEKEITIPAYKVVSVFDVSQTEGRELPDIAVDELTGDVDRYKDFFAALEKTSPVPIGFEKIEGGAHGYYHLENKRIAIDEGMSQLQTLKTAIHEIAHAKLHDIDLNAPKDEQPRVDRRTREVEAESVAYTVCQHYGLDTSDYSFGYVAGWSSGRELAELKSSLETIRSAAAEIINSIDANIAELQKAQDKEQTAGQEQPEQEAEKAAEPDKDTFSIYQLKRGDETRDFRFEPYDRLQAAGLSVEAANYDLIYTAPLTPDMTLESIWEKFNIDHPKDFKGHSLSVSDVVVLHQNGQDTAHYVDSFGYKNVPEFLQEQKQLTPDELETGETIKTPRGTFYVTDMSHEQMEAAGYGFHHQSDDGKYFIMGNGTRAFAIAAEPPENYLKTAEQTTEQNYNMIDGQINNTPTVDELEAKVKAGETISLVDLANAVKADKERGKAKPEKKPSIRAQLLADKEKAQKKPAKQKSQDLERS
jgi:DNA modification methylase/antirestriction protein ArdC